MRLGIAARVVRGENWYLSRYNEYARNRDLESERDALQHIMTLPRRVREYSWSASSAGTCPRQRQLAFLGMPRRPTEDRSLNIFANGDYVHLRHQAFGIVGGYIAATEVSVAMPQYNLLGTMDGILTNGNGLEIKSINTRGYSQVNTFGVKAEHVRQVHAYMLASNLPGFHVVYEDKNTQLIKEIFVPRNEKMIAEIKEELERLNEATNERRLLPMLQECRNGEGQYRWCDFARICEEAEWPSKSRRLIPATSSSDDG